MRSIRKFLISRLLVALLILFSASGAALYLGARAFIVAQFDAGLEAKARSLATLVEWEGDGKIEFEFADEIMTEYSRAESPEYFQLWIGEDRVLERSRSLAGGDLPRLGGSLDAPEFVNLALPDGRSGRAAGIMAVARADEEIGEHESGEDHGQEARTSAAAPPVIYLTVAADRSPLDRAMAGLMLLFAIFGIAVPAGVALIVGAVVRRGLSPVRHVATAADAITPESISGRVETSGLPDELQPIAASLNAMLARLEIGLERERRFRRDAAHELRTPIAELRTAAEVALRSPEDAPLHQQTLETSLDIARQMERLTQALLALARAENGSAAAAKIEIDLAAEARKAWARVAAIADERHLLVTFDFAAVARILSDPDMIAAMLHILAENAAIHSPEGSEVVWRIEQSHDGLALTVSNLAPSLTAADLAYLAEPFWQKDPARTPSSHAGLGLSLLAAYAAVLNVHIEPILDNQQLIVKLSFECQSNDQQLSRS